MSISRRETLRYFILHSKWEKIDQKLLKRLDEVKTDEEELRELEKLMSTQGEMIDSYTSARDLHRDLKAFRRSLRSPMSDQKCRVSMDKLQIFDAVFTFPADDVLLPPLVNAFRRRLIRLLDGTYELISEDNVVKGVDTFTEFLRSEPKQKLTVSTWTVEKVLEQFSNLYDKNQDREAILELKELMTSVAKSKPPKKNAKWFAEMYRRHALYMNAMRGTFEAHPLIFRPQAKNKKLPKPQVPTLRVFQGDPEPFVFQEDVLTLIHRALKNKGYDPKDISCFTSLDPSKEGGFLKLRPFDKELLQGFNMLFDDFSIVQQPATRHIGYIGSLLMSPYGSWSKPVTYVFQEMLTELIYGLQVWSRLEIEELEAFEKDFLKICEQSVTIRDGYDFMECSTADELMSRIVTELEPKLKKKPKSSSKSARKTTKIESGVGFDEGDLRKEIENLNLAAYYPEILDHIGPVYWEVLDQRTRDFLKQSDLVVAVRRCLGKVFSAKFKPFSTFKDSEDRCLTDSDADSESEVVAPVSAGPKRVKFQHHSEFVTETLDFVKLGETHRVLRQRCGDERVFDNKSAMTYMFVTLWDRIRPSLELPKRLELEDVVDASEDLRMLLVTEKELMELVGRLEKKFKEALKDREERKDQEDRKDHKEALFRILEKQFSEALLNVKAFNAGLPGRRVILRTFAMVRLDTNEKTFCFAAELLELLKLLLESKKMTKEDQELLDSKTATWQSADEWVMVPVAEIADVLLRLPVDTSRFRFVPDARDLCHMIQRPFVDSKKTFRTTVRSPHYTWCSSMKRIHSGTILGAASGLKTDLRSLKDVDVETSAFLECARKNCTTNGWINVGNSQTFVTIDTVTEMIPATTATLSTKKLLEIAVNAEQKYRAQLGFLNLIYREEPEIKKIMAEEISFEVFEPFVDLADFEQWVASDFKVPRSGDKEAVAEWMKRHVENNRVTKVPEAQEVPKASEVAPKDSGEALKDSEGSEDVKTPEAPPKPPKSKKKKPVEVQVPSTSPASSRHTTISKFETLCSDWESESGVKLDSKFLEGLLGLVQDALKEQNSITNNVHQEVESIKKQLATTNGDLLARHEEIEAMQKTREKKWEKEMAAMHKALDAKAKIIGALEDRIEVLNEQLDVAEQRRKADLAKKEVEVEKMKEKLERQEQTYRRKLDSVEELTAKCARLEALERELTEGEAADSARIRQLTHEKNTLAAKNRELNRRLGEPSSADNEALRQIQNGLQKLMNPTDTRSTLIAQKLEALETRLENLERDKLLGKAIVAFRDFSSTSRNEKRVAEAKGKLDEYRRNYHSHLNAVKATIKLIKEDCTLRPDELAPIPAYPKPFSLEPSVPADVQDVDCLICLNDMKPREQITKCDVCRRQFHAQCVSGWLQVNSICPVCRSPLPDPAEFPPLR